MRRCCPALNFRTDGPPISCEFTRETSHVAQSFIVNGSDIALGFADEASYEHKDNP